MDLGLRGKVALVTAGGKGVGGGGARGVARLAAAPCDRLGPVDVLVANAGGPPRGTFGELDDAQWLGAFELSLLSTVRLIRAVLPGMRQRRWGRVITIQSSSVKQPIPGLLLSNAVRPGVAGLLKTR